MSPTIERKDDQALLLDALRGQNMHIPDLASLLYPDWVVERHRDEPQLQHEILKHFGPRLVSICVRY